MEPTKIKHPFHKYEIDFTKIRVPKNNQLLLEHLTKKLVILLCILSGQRSQSIASLCLDFMHKCECIYTFYSPTVLKTTTPTFHQAPLIFEVFVEDDRLCVVNCLDEFISRTELIRENTEDIKQLILSYTYPHKSIKSETLARYAKLCLGMAGIPSRSIIISPFRKTLVQNC